MELKFGGVWGGPVSLETISIVFLVGLILLATWIVLRRVTNPRVSGMAPALLLAVLAWYGLTTAMIASLGVQTGEDPMARNSTLGGWLAELRRILHGNVANTRSPKRPPNNGAAADPGARHGIGRWYYLCGAPGRLSAWR